MKIIILALAELALFIGMWVVVNILTVFALNGLRAFASRLQARYSDRLRKAGEVLQMGAA